MTVTGDPELLAADRIELLCRLERWADAVGPVTRLLATDPDNDIAWCQLAQCRLGLGDPEAALTAAGQAAAIAPENEWPHRLVSFAASSLGRHELAVRAADEAVRLEPHAWQTHARLAAAQLRRCAHAGRLDRAARGHRAAAAAAAARAVELGPDEPQAHLVRGSVAAAQGRRDDARRHYRTALALDPQSSAAHHLLATLSLRAGAGPRELASAAAGFATALAADPTTQASRRSLELTLHLAAGRAAYGLFAVAYLGQLLSPVRQPWARAVPVLLLSLPIAYLARFALRLEPRLRAFSRRLARDRAIGSALALEALCVGLLLVAAFAPPPVRAATSVGAAVLALVARLLLYTGSRRGGVVR